MLADSSNSTSLRNRVLRAGGWSLGGHALAQIIRLMSNLVLTRLLMPEMFGLMAIVNILIIGIALFSDIGLSQNIIHSRRGEDAHFLNTAWSLQILRGILMWSCALLFSAGLYVIGQHGWLRADSVYANTQLPAVISVFGLTALIAGFESTKLALARRRLAIAPIIRVEIICQLVALVATIIWAKLQPTIWALVAGAIISGLIKVVLTHVLLPGPRNSWSWDRGAVADILRFGKWLFLSSIFGFLVINGDRLLLGGFVNAYQLGLYSIAFLIMNSVQVAFTQLVSGVAFPALSEVARNNAPQLRATYYRFRLPIDLAMLFCAGLFFSLGSTLIHLLYDARYYDAGSILKTLGLALIAARYLLAEQCYLALGKPGIQTIINLVRLVAMYILVPIAYRVVGFDGAVWAIALNQFASLPVIFYFKRRYRLLDVRKELIVLPALLAGVLGGKFLCLVLS